MNDFLQENKKTFAIESYINLFINDLISNHYQKLTVKNYRSDLYCFSKWISSNPQFSITNKNIIDNFRTYLEKSQTTENTIKRKIATLKIFLNFLTQNHYILKNQTQEDTKKRKQTGEKLNLFKQILFSFSIITISLILSFIGIKQLLKNYQLKTDNKLEGVVLGVSAPNYISFQGRLTNRSETPITSPTNFRFRIYSDATGDYPTYGLWDSGTCTITPDQDGIFSFRLGDTTSCGSAEIPDSVFGENAETYLGITVGSDSEMNIRQKISASAYAFNADTLDGFNSSQTPGANNVVVLDSSGYLSFGITNPQIRATDNTANNTLTLTNPNGSYLLSLSIEGDLSVLGNDITFGNGENINNTTDDILAFIGTGGGDNTDLYLNLDGTFPILYSNTDTAIEINDDLYIPRGNGIKDQNGVGLFGFDSSYNANIQANTNVTVDIDNNNNDTIRYFEISHNNGTSLFKVNESGTIGVSTTASAPATCIEGEIFANDNGNIYYCETTNTWVDLTIQGSTYTFTNGLTESPTGTAKLGGTLSENTAISTSSYNFSIDSLYFDNTNLGTATDADLLAVADNSLTVNGAIHLGDNLGTYYGLDNNFHLYYDETTDDRLELTSTNQDFYLGLGTGKLNILGTSEQLRLGYDTSNYSTFTVDSNGNLSIGDTGTTAATFGATKNTFSVPTEFTANGDVTFAYDAQFTNQIASQIKSFGPFSLIAGDSYESNNLTLKTYNNGDIILDNATNGTIATFKGTGNVGIDTTNPQTSLSLGSTATTGISLYNTVDEITNYERLRLFWNSNDAVIKVENAGTGTARNLYLHSARDLILKSGVAQNIYLDSGNNYIFRDIDNADATTAQIVSSTGFARFGDATSPSGYSIEAANGLWVDSGNAIIDNNLGIGTTGPDAKIDALATSGQQLRLTYTDGSIYSGFTVNSSGDLTTSATGGDFSYTDGTNTLLSIIDGGTNGILRITTTASTPGTCTVGDVYANSNGNIYYCEATNTWVDLTTGGSTAYTFMNGLTENPAGTVNLGGTLSSNVSLNTNSYNFSIDSLYFDNANLGTATDADLLAVADNSLTVNGAIHLGDNLGTYYGVDNNFHLYYDETTDDRLELTSTNQDFYLGLGTGKLNILGTSEQLRLGYDTSNYSTFTVDSSGNLSIGDTGTTAATFGATKNTFSVPTEFTANGDVGFSYDAQFTNQIASQIESLGPFSLIAGEAFESNNLTLKTYNNGDIILDNATNGTIATFKGTGAVGIGTTGPDAKLDSLATSGEQLRLTYTDGSIYSGFTVNSSGNLSISATGGNTSFTDGTNTLFSILDGGTNGILRIATTASTPGTCTIGDVYANSNGNMYYCESSNTWVDLTVQGGSASYTFTNGLTESPAGTVNLGGTLTANVAINTSTFNFSVDSIYFDNANIGTATDSDLLGLADNALTVNGTIANSVGNLVLNDTVDIGSATTGIEVATTGAINDIDGNLVLNDITDIGSATTGINITTAGAISDIDGNLVLNDQTDIGSTTTGIRVTTAGAISDIDGNLVLNDTTDIGSSANGIRVATDGSILDINANLILNDTTDIGSSANGIRVATDGSILDINANLILNDTTDIGSSTTGIEIATTGAINDIDGNLVLNDITDIGSATTGINITTAGTISDTDGNVVINDTVDLGSATTGVNITTTGAISDIDGNLVLNDITDIGSATTGINITTAGAISDIDGSIYLNDTVGIGVSSASALLHVLGTTEQLRLGYDASNYSSFTVDSLGNLSISDSGTTAAIFGATKNTLSVPTEFTASGDVSIAYDLIFTNQTAEYIQSYGPLSIESGESFENNNLTLRTYGTGNIIANLGTSGAFLPGTDDTYNIGSSSYRWNDIYATNNVIQTSDIRFKENIQELSYGLDTLMKLNPVSYTWKNKPERGTKLGLIAQEVLPIVPETVDVGTDENQTLGIRYTDFVPILIKSIQEQQIIIDDLKIKDAMKSAEIGNLKSQQQELINTISKLEITLSNQNTLINRKDLQLNKIALSELDINNTIVINDKGISSKTSPLQIQPIATQPISLMADMVTIDTNGNVSIKGNLAIDGSLQTTGIVIKEKGNEDQNILSIQDEQGQENAAIKSNGSSYFREVVAGRFAAIKDKESTSSATLLGDIIFKNNSAAGKSTIPVDKTEVKILNSSIKKDSLIYVTPTNSTQNQTLYIKEQKECAAEETNCQNYFIVKTDNPTSTEINFNWWIIDVQE